MKKYIPYAIIVILAFLLWQKSCKSEQEVITVTVPEIKGSFDTITKFEQIPVKAPFEVVKWKDKIVYTENPVNQDLVNELKEALEQNDSLKALAMFSDAVAIREYKRTLEDSLLITDNYFKTQGKLLEFSQYYTIKEHKISVPVKDIRFRLLGKIEVGNTIQLDNFNAKGSLMFQNQKGNIFSIGYDTDKRIYAGYGFTIFKVR